MTRQQLRERFEKTGDESETAKGCGLRQKWLTGLGLRQRRLIEMAKGLRATVDRLNSQLSNEFEMKDLGAVKKILGMEMHKDRQAGKLYLSQKKPVSTRLGTCITLVRNMNAIKWILRYLKGTSSFGLVFDRNSSMSTDIVGIVDSDYATLQSIVALSTIETEYIAAT
nr:Retrovirus-related Pol polyprotein from transposon TNT 1-94 [Ipomoea batatas]